MDSDKIARGDGPEDKYDAVRHEKMRLRPLFRGKNFFMPGTKPDVWCGCGCGRLKVWCPTWGGGK